MTGILSRIPSRAGRVAAIMVGVVAALLLLLAAFPWGVLAGFAVAPASRALGRPVTIASARRLDWFSLAPEIALSNVTVAQPSMLGGGPMAAIREARVTVPVVPLLLGRFRLRGLVLDGVRLTLLRDEQGRASWDGDGKSDGRHHRPSLTALTIRDGTVTLDDLKRHAKLAGTIAADVRGLAVDARGTLRDRPLALVARGGPIGGDAGSRPYPLHLVARAPQVTMDAAVTMDRPLDTGAFSGRLTAHGDDLEDLDDLVQAGLFATRPFELSGSLRRDGPRWAIRDLRAKAGRSVLAGKVDVERRGPRTGLDATIDASALDFDDFTSPAQRARAAAKERAIGERIVPGTRLVLGGLGKVDGTVRLTARRLLAGPGSPFRALATTATLDHGRLTLDPLDVTLVAGHATGTLVDDDRGGTPRATLDLKLSGATVETLLAKSGAIRGPLEGRLRLEGRGETLRDAIGRSDGIVGFAVPRGTTRRDYATFAGGDVGKSIGAAIDGGDDRIALRCMVGRFVAKDGRLAPDPLVIDTAVSRADGLGSIDLSTERLDLAMVGRPKQPGLLRSTAPTRITGTLSKPVLDIRPPRAPESGATGVVARVGYFLKGLKVRTKPSNDPPAPDADCPALIRAALR